jgi:acyl-CoA thioesterase FadM
VARASWALPLRHCEAEFLRPLRFGDEIEVALVEAALRESEFILGHRISMDGKAAMLARTLHVSIDRTTFRRAPLPDAVRAVLARLAR